MQFKPERYESTFFINDVTVRLLHSSDSEGFAKAIPDVGYGR